jgi:hypothetical protein
MTACLVPLSYGMTISMIWQMALWHDPAISQATAGK